jgi:hypothetical protein
VTPSGVQYLQGGGSVFEPRGTDTVPAMLTPGERVLSVDETKAYDERQKGQQLDPRVVRTLERIANSVEGQADALLLGFRDIMLSQA